MAYLAKTNNKNQTLIIETHLNDTEYVMNYLLNNYCPDSTFNASGLDRDDFIAIARFTASVHDIGKATPMFQQKLNGNTSSFAHALAGASILNRVFGVGKDICNIIAAHHGKIRGNSKEENLSYYFKKNKKLLGDDIECWTKLFDSAVEKGGNNLDLNCEIPVNGQMLLSGLLIMADWIASNEEYFPLYNDESELSELDYIIRRKSGIKRLSLPSGWNPNIYQMDNEIFKHRFGFTPNVVQKELINIANYISNPGITILEAPMGIGKTEVALAISEILATHSGCSGSCFGLPTKGTANGMLPRMLSWADSATENLQSSFILSHSDAKNNEQYKAFFANIDDDSGITLNEWLSGRHRALLNNFCLGTVDQILMAGLLKKFIMLLHLGISEKVIIIDEVHAYDAYTTSYLDAVLAWTGVYHVPVILLSATLPVQKKKEFLHAYTNCDVFPDMNGYPCVTWSDGDKVFSKNLTYTGKEKEVQIKYISTNDCVKQIKQQNTCCIGFIVNSVIRAQNLYNILKKQIPDRTIVLIHSRFLSEDRNKKENEVLKYVGKNSTKELREGTIVIGTQVLEQSLDIDFDILYTEKCPIDLLFQRIGREWRHERTDRPVKNQYCYIVEDEKSEKTARLLYKGNYLIEQTDKVLKKGIVKIPQDIRRFTEYVYDLNQAENSMTKQEFEILIKEMKSQAKSFLIDNPKYATFVGLMDNITVKENGVRSGNDSVEILLLKRFNNGCIGTIDESVKVEKEPSHKEINRILNQSITLPYYMVDFDAIKLSYENFPNWIKTGIFKYKTVLILDQNDRYVVSNDQYIYDRTYGFKKNRKDKYEFI